MSTVTTYVVGSYVFQGTEQLQIKKKLPREITRNGYKYFFGIIEKSVTLTEQGYVK